MSGSTQVHICNLCKERTAGNHHSAKAQRKLREHVWCVRSMDAWTLILKKEEDLCMCMSERKGLFDSPVASTGFKMARERGCCGITIASHTHILECGHVLGISNVKT